MQDNNKRALISVSNKAGLEIFAETLQNKKWEIISTGGTAKFLQEKGFGVTEVSSVTGSPEILEGRVKTLQSLAPAAITRV